MRTVYFMAVMIGLSSAAIQQRSPVYQPSATSPGSTTSVNSTPLKSPPLTTPMTPASLPTSVSAQPVAQPRESVGTDASMLQPTAVNPSTPSQNYYVYYYPNNGASPSTGIVGQPNSAATVWSLAGWSDVAIGVGCLALVVVGGGILYSRYGHEVKQRALRELKDLSADDAARMARGVLRALEKFSAMNNHTE